MKRQREHSVGDLCRNKRRKIINKINHCINYDINVTKDDTVKKNIIFNNNIIKAKTEGSVGQHDVEIKIENNKLNFNCDCQLNAKNSFCKHSLNVISHMVMEYVRSASDSLEDHIQGEIYKDLIDKLSNDMNKFSMN